MKRTIFYLILCCVLAACATSPPSNHDDICSIFMEKPKWYKSAVKSAHRWGGPIHVPMAIIYQESSFKHNAKPAMQYFLGFIPHGRKSNAFGYSQALDSTWERYQRETGSRFKGRDNFANSFDFVQWYMQITYTTNGVSKWDARAQYLNYHEGQGGYARGTYRGKQWLLNTADRVASRSSRYNSQLTACKARLDKATSGWF
jgi:hypothetical protein